MWGESHFDPSPGNAQSCQHLQVGNRSQTRIQKFSFTEFKVCFAMCAFDSDSYSQIYIYMLIYTSVFCKHIQVSPGPAAQLIAALGAKLVLAFLKLCLQFSLHQAVLSEALCVAVTDE